MTHSQRSQMWESQKTYQYLCLAFIFLYERAFVFRLYMLVNRCEYVDWTHISVLLKLASFVLITIKNAKAHSVLVPGLNIQRVLLFLNYNWLSFSSFSFSFFPTLIKYVFKKFKLLEDIENRLWLPRGLRLVEGWIGTSILAVANYYI